MSAINVDLDDAQRAFALTVHCPFCDQEPGLQCRPGDARYHVSGCRGPHVVRVKRAARIAIEGMCPAPRYEDRPGLCEQCGQPPKAHHVDRRKSTVIITCPEESK